MRLSLAIELGIEKARILTSRAGSCHVGHRTRPSERRAGTAIELTCGCASAINKFDVYRNNRRRRRADIQSRHEMLQHEPGARWVRSGSETWRAVRTRRTERRGQNNAAQMSARFLRARFR